jgi:NodT family efflux transporter outer membrane factor (OMF) lipoprotein
MVSLSSDLASTYVQIRTLEERVQIARDNLIIQQESLRIARARFEGGATSERDVQQALTQLNATEASIPQLESSLRQAKNALGILLAVPPMEVDPLLKGDSRIPLVPQKIAVGIPADLLRRRPDIRLAELRAVTQCSRIGIAKADLYPMFSLTGSFGLLSTDAGQFGLGDLFSWKSRYGFIGPTFQWNILNYGQITNQVRIQDARFQELLLDYQNTVLNAQKEVEDGLVAFVKAQEKVRSLALAAEAAKRSVDLSMIQYREGATDYTTVLTAQQALLLQQDNLVIGRGDVPQGLVSIYRALGGGWEMHTAQDYIPPEILETMKKRTDWGDLLTPAAVEAIPQEKKDALFRAPDW